ncbi:MAG: hypothetical protein ACRD0N_14110 [Acidimicrobiales bacterium]
MPARAHHLLLRPWRRRTASGVFCTAIALGMRHGLDARPDGEPVVVDAAGDPPDRGGPLQLYFDAKGPRETWAVVRPWLLPRQP